MACSTPANSIRLASRSRFAPPRNAVTCTGKRTGVTPGKNRASCSVQLCRSAISVGSSNCLTWPHPPWTLQPSGPARPARRRHTKESQENRSTPGTKRSEGRLQGIVKNQWQLRFRTTWRSAHLSQAETNLSQPRVRCRQQLDLVRHRLRLFNVRFGLHGDIVTFEFAIKSCATDPQHFACERFVTVGLFEDAENGHALHFRQRGGR
jgi:hypothetical protein